MLFPLCIQQFFILSITETSLFREQIIVNVKNLSYLMVTNEFSTIVKCCLEEQRPRLFCSWHFSLLQCPPHCWSGPTFPCLLLQGVIAFSTSLSRNYTNSSSVGKWCEEDVIICTYSLLCLTRLLQSIYSLLLQLVGAINEGSFECWSFSCQDKT